MARSDEFINIASFKNSDGEVRYEIELFQGINILQTDRGSSDTGFTSVQAAERYARAVFPGRRIE